MKRKYIKTLKLAIAAAIIFTIAPLTDTFGQGKKRAKTTKYLKATTPVKQYEKLPRFGAQLATLPGKVTSFRYGQFAYHFRDGIFYRPVNGSFVIGAPPIGIKITHLPTFTFTFLHLGLPYHYYYGTYYVTTDDGAYEVVAAPVGARVDALPDGYEVFELDGKVYYIIDNTYYKAVADKSGEIFYEVIRV